ncbi:Uncharacterized membrane protein YphA, DoxX/SURF4 family [Flavobacterium sp. CF108]|uniref:MauE/DoxX family redox-associated membrane protein n=1 Tax=Flavobacterium sp. CF108 TaxID=1882758 RepID=UPI00091E6E76|nr:MauE/DoxX family redox-associated membrane protein [Flavobacterium sp. CF108]SHH92552.1 Uncharacterized membrane protein YphA, DoxX/SURF4 family [Flavobacterium sp. CF108]
MNLKTNIKRNIIEVVYLLYVLLFVYAAVSKLLDFENFQVQIGQSPLLSAFAQWVSWLVPIIELLIAFLLLLPKFKNLGLYAAFSLMIMFTAYIFIVLHYSSFVPCSCGGILEKMSWEIHLIFNLFFVLLAALAIISQNDFSIKQKGNNSYLPIKKMATLSVLSIGVIIVLFLISEKIMHNENPFIRRYANHPATFLDQKDLQFNSYYFAGVNRGRIYLGNYTTALKLLSFDSKLQNKLAHTIIFDPKKIPFRRVTIRLKERYFYLKDGSVPAVFRGSISDWKINTEIKGLPYFNQAEPMDSSSLVFRSNNGLNLANILGVFRSDKTPKIKYNSSLLQKQIDGVFDTDGMLVYNEKTNKIVYVYFYRNEFIVADKMGKLDYRGHTIDTTTKAKIKVSYLEDRQVRKMSAPPFIVNANVAVYSNLLFIHSKVKGQYENDKLWEQASIVDLYDLNKKSYLMSFPIYNIGDQKLKSFIVTSTSLYAIIGNYLVVYDLKTSIKKEMKGGDLKNY